MWLGLTLTALSGTLMFIATPKLYYFNPAFRWKMLLFFIAVVVQLALFRRAASQESPSPRVCESQRRYLARGVVQRRDGRPDDRLYLMLNP